MAKSSNIVRSVKSLRSRVASWRNDDKKIALVPTMGALHEGHLSLVELAKKKAEKVIVSIFVNPTQFGKNEDLSKYPRDEKSDIDKLNALNTDLIYIPSVGEIYPEGFSTVVAVSGITEGLCGASRPTHFAGVSTIVTKLLLQAAPDFAIFGEKDYQQLLVIRRFVRDLNIPVKILGGRIIREKSGLAMSSRNRYLSKAERAVAENLNRILKDTASRMKKGAKPHKCLEEAKAELSAVGFQIDYLDLREINELSLINNIEGVSSRLFAAVFVGKTRLIDNIKVS